jgi:hypothetical protein
LYKCYNQKVRAVKNVIKILVTIGRVIVISLLLAIAPIIYGKKYDNEDDNEGDFNNDYIGDDYSVYYAENEYETYQLK